MTRPFPNGGPGDIAWLVVSLIGVVLCALWSGANGDTNENLCKAINGLGDGLEGVAKAFTFLGSIWFVAIVVVLLLFVRWPAAARDAAIAGGGAWLVAIGINALAETQSVSTLDVRTGDGPVFLTASVATAMALLVALAPYVVRPYRRLGILLVAGVATSAVYLGTGLASDVIGALFLGVVTGAAVHIAFGAPGGRPTMAELREALGQLGFDVSDLRDDPVPVPRATAVDATTRAGTHLRVLAFGRDQRDGQYFSKLWRSLAYREPGVAVFGTRLQQVEHLAYGCSSPRGRRPGPSLPQDRRRRARRRPADHRAGGGHPLADLGDQVPDAVLASAWEQLDKLHDGGHRARSSSTPRASSSTTPRSRSSTLAQRTSAPRSTGSVATPRRLLVLSAQLVGDDRAIAAALAALGREQLGAVIPYVQPATLPKALTKGQKHLGKTLKQMRAALTTATGVEDVPPLKIQRLTWINIGMLAGVLLAVGIGISSLEGIDWQSILSEFENATWSWALLALILYPLVPIAWATALMGCVTKDLALVTTTMVQLACSFLNLITPNGIGGTALQIDYLHHQDVPIASAGSAMVLSTGVGGAIQMILFLIAAAITATSLDSYDTGGSVTLGAIAVVAALIGIILWIPKVRNKVMPAAKKAAERHLGGAPQPEEGRATVRRRPGRQPHLPRAPRVVPPRVPPESRLRATHGRADRRRNARQRGARTRRHRRARSRTHGRTHRVRNSDQPGARDRGGLPHHHLPSPPVFGYFTLRRLRAQGIA